jgi:hypothetical protein
MSFPTGTFSTYSAIGVREDLTDVIYDISPTETPFMSNAKRGTCTQKLVEWQTDSLAAAASTGTLEGDEATGQSGVPTVRWGNYCVIQTKVPVVSGTLQVSNAAGRADEMSYQVAKRSKELKRNIEKTLLGTQGATAGAAADARMCAGVGRWVPDDMNLVKLAPTGWTVSAFASGVPVGDAVTSSTVSALTEGMLKSAIALAWTDGGDPSLILCNASTKQVISGFTGIATQYRDNPQVGAAVIIGAADVYVSDFGTHYIVADRFMPTGMLYCLDMEYWEVAYLRPFQSWDLAKTGDTERKQILVEYTLKALNRDSGANICGVA